MTGGSCNHETIGGTLRALLRERLHGKQCRVLGPTMKIAVAGRARYPAAFVHCAPVAASATVLREPLVIFAVIGPGTSRADRIEKLREYQATESVRRYVIPEQASIAATVTTRRGDVWDLHALVAGDLLDMPEIGVALPRADIYADVELPSPDQGETVENA
jgi:Uma2 family endonuclease